MIKINKNITLNNIKFDYLLRINPRCKSLRISIDFQGIKVTIPRGVNMDYVESFLHSKKDWIIEHCNKNNEDINNKLYFEGNEITYQILMGLEKNSIEFENNMLKINLSKELNSDDIRLIIKNWYIQKAIDSFNKSIKVYSQLIGVKFNRICLREQKTRWGSCSSKGNLNFNWKLIMAPSFVLEYIVVHELCHLIHMNHSKVFWLKVEEFMPDYRSAELWLKLNSRKLNF